MRSYIYIIVLLLVVLGLGYLSLSKKKVILTDGVVSRSVVTIPIITESVKDTVKGSGDSKGKIKFKVKLSGKKTTVSMIAIVDTKDTTMIIDGEMITDSTRIEHTLRVIDGETYSIAEIDGEIFQSELKEDNLQNILGANDIPWYNTAIVGSVVTIAVILLLVIYL